jgi:hypothetical protein
VTVTHLDTLLLKLVLTPALIGAASLAARRWVAGGDGGRAPRETLSAKWGTMGRP